MTPAEAGEVTEYQFWELYVNPAVERQRRTEERGGKRPGRVKSKPPTREEFVRSGVALGGDPEAMGEGYDRWAASPEGRRVLGE
jgi:hypothetical protein